MHIFHVISISTSQMSAPTIFVSLTIWIGFMKLEAFYVAP